MPDDAKPVTFPIRRILLDLTTPKVAHGFGWARVDNQFLLELGYFDLKVMSEMIVAAKGGNPAPSEGGLDLFITDRFVLDLASAGRLVDSMRQLIAEYEALLPKVKSNAGE